MNGLISATPTKEKLVTGLDCVESVTENLILGGKFMNSNWAIIGMGFIASRHINSIQRVGGNVILTCDIDPAKNADYLDWKKMQKDMRWKKITHVAICTPNYLHYEMAQSFGDKIVLCEKPITINSKDALKLGQNVNAVLQLRYHPRLQDLFVREVSITAKMFRDDSYWKGWKGNREKSGGILFNLGIHYIDLLIFLLGEPIGIIKAYTNHYLAVGEISFERGIGRFQIEILDSREGQYRKIMVDGKEISLSDKDNLSYEDLHLDVYHALLKGEGIKPKEAARSIKLVEQIYAM
jgi:UDP-N-acetyl-2-amino-2-deoxyglucuronate dehydrogenase